MEVLAYLLSWTTYGSWLHGDDRGWVEAGEYGIQPPNPERYARARELMTEPPVILNEAQRRLVETTIRDHCHIRGWTLHAVNPRTNHVHVVVTADRHPDEVLRQLKAWCSRRLSDLEKVPEKQDDNGRKRWWTEHGSTKWIKDEEYLRNAIRYVNERQ